MLFINRGQPLAPDVRKLAFPLSTHERRPCYAAMLLARGQASERMKRSDFAYRLPHCK